MSINGRENSRKDDGYELVEGDVVQGKTPK